MIKQANINSIIFNQDGGSYWITDFQGLEMPPVRVSNYNLSGAHFGVYVDAFYGKRVFNIRGWVTGTNQSTFIANRDSLQNALSILNGEIPISLTLGNDRQISIDAVTVKLDFSPDPGQVVASKFNIQFEASYPFLVSTADTTTNLSLGTGGGGTVPPTTMPMELLGNSGGLAYLTNQGNAPAYPVIRITGNVTNPAITNSTTGKSIRINAVLASGEYVDIDFKRKTITDNTGANRYSYKSGDWFYLLPGSNTIRFTADSYSSEANAQIVFQDTYLGI